MSPETTDAADVALLLDEEHRAVVAAANKLPRRQQQVIALRYWADMTDPEIAEALGVSAVTERSTASVPGDLGTVLIGQPRCRTLINRAVRALVAINLAAGTLHEVYADRLLHVYVVTGRLQAPSGAQIAGQSAGHISDHC